MNLKEKLTTVIKNQSDEFYGQPKDFNVFVCTNEEAVEDVEYADKKWQVQATAVLEDRNSGWLIKEMVGVDEDTSIEQAKAQAALNLVRQLANRVCSFDGEMVSGKHV
mgnify:CR=1 FL=1